MVSLSGFAMAQGGAQDNAASCDGLSAPVQVLPDWKPEASDLQMHEIDQQTFSAHEEKRWARKRRKLMSSFRSVKAFVEQPSIALLGISRSGKKFGNAAYHELTTRGYRVYPIHPYADVIGGIRCYRTFQELPEQVDAALIVLPPPQAVAAVHAAAASGIHHIWLQHGADSAEVLAACRHLGLDTVSENAFSCSQTRGAITKHTAGSGNCSASSMR
jgi:predicted CoA-binding protein